MNVKLKNKGIPVKLSEEEFVEFFWEPYFSSKKSQFKD
jgi:hypothetical protein